MPPFVRTVVVLVSIGAVVVAGGAIIETLARRMR